MEHRAIDSSHIASAGYENGTLEITFADGRTYQYFGVPQNIAEHFFSADSHGKYFHSTIRDYYQSERV